MYDIIVVGGGPAGLTAAIYARRADKTVLVVEKGAFGGQITYSPKVENIPGFVSVTGNEFAEKLVEQAIEQGVEFEYGPVTEVRDGNVKTVVTEDGSFEALAVIIATGARHRRLGLENEDKFVGDGISFCAVCDGAFFRGKRVAVIGGGNSALQEALQLSELVEKVYIVQNLGHLTGEAALAAQVGAKDNIEVLLGAQVTEILGDDVFEGIIVSTSDKRFELKIDGMFEAIGLIPQNEAFAGLITLDKWGYADCGESCETGRAGVYVAGDCRKKAVRQVTTAVSDGAVAALAACRYIDAR